MSARAFASRAISSRASSPNPQGRANRGSGIVGRFAPSPTGRLHLGNIASMLVAWLAARVQGGRVLLRIEDIDEPRAVKDADRWIMEDLAWLGLDWDGEPIWQSQRLDLYEQKLHGLEDLLIEGPEDGHFEGHAGLSGSAAPFRPAEHAVFPCFCSRRDLREASAPQGSDGFVIYPGTCRRFAADPPDPERLEHRHSLRLAMPRVGAPDEVQSFVDAVYGRQSWDLPRDIGDVVIRRSDRLFAYQLVVTIDDLEQGVTQIVRGRDLLRSTAVQMWIRRCLLAVGEGDRFAQQHDRPVVTDPLDPTAVPTPQAPEYLHIPLILGTDGRRLAKRDGALEVATLRRQGVPPDAVIGYLAAVLGLVPPHSRSERSRAGGNISASDFEPISAQDLLARLTPQALVHALKDGGRKRSVGPQDRRVDPRILTGAAGRAGDRLIRRRLVVHGRVQGVGFRWFAVQLAQRYGVTGWVRNDLRGSVTLEVQGTAGSVQRMAEAVGQGPSWSRVERVDSTGIPVRRDDHGFRVAYNHDRGER